MKSVSLIILTYNNTRFLRPVLKSAFAQTHSALEIIVADDGSKEDTFELVKEMAKNSPYSLKYVWQADTGFRIARSRNNAASVATGDVLIFADGDMLLHPKFVADHVELSDDSIMLQGSRVVLSDETTAKIINNENLKLPHFFTKGILYNRLKSVRCKFLSRLHFTKQVYDKGVRGCNMSLTRKTFNMINGFDNRFEGWGREDYEFVARLLNSSIKRKNIKNYAVGYHMYHPEVTREALPINDKMLEDTVQNKTKVTDHGVKQVSDFKSFQFK